MPGPRTLTEAERRTVALWLLTLSRRPVGDTEPAEVYLDRVTLSRAWEEVAQTLPVRRALRRFTGRTLGARGFNAAVRDLSATARERNQSNRADAAEEAAEEIRDYIADETDPETGTMSERALKRLAGLYEEADEVAPLPDHREDNEAAVSCRKSGNSERVRLLRPVIDGDGDDETAPLWELLLDSFSTEVTDDEDDEGTSLDVYLAEAVEVLGFTVTEPLPSEWLCEVSSRAYNADEDAAPSKPREPQEKSPAPPKPKPKPAPAPVAAADDDDDESAPRPDLDRFTPGPMVVPEPLPFVPPSRRNADRDRLDTPQELYARLTRERAAEAERIAPRPPIAQPRRWECASCGDLPRVVSPTPPKFCKICAGTSFT